MSTPRKLKPSSNGEMLNSGHDLNEVKTVSVRTTLILLSVVTEREKNVVGSTDSASSSDVVT